MRTSAIVFVVSMAFATSHTGTLLAAWPFEGGGPVAPAPQYSLHDAYPAAYGTQLRRPAQMADAYVNRGGRGSVYTQFGRWLGYGFGDGYHRCQCPRKFGLLGSTGGVDCTGASVYEPHPGCGSGHCAARSPGRVESSRHVADFREDVPRSSGTVGSRAA